MQWSVRFHHQPAYHYYGRDTVRRSPRGDVLHRPCARRRRGPPDFRGYQRCDWRVQGLWHIRWYVLISGSARWKLLSFEALFCRLLSFRVCNLNAAYTASNFKRAVTWKGLIFIAEIRILDGNFNPHSGLDAAIEKKATFAMCTY